MTGFVFYTTMGARGTELDANHARRSVLWNELERQVRVQGTVAKVSREESEAYFKLRPVKSRFGAAVSPQSAVIPGRAFLEERMWHSRRSLGRRSAEA